VRDEPLAADTLVVLRAAAADMQRTVRNAVTDATESGLTYVIVRNDGTREILYSISVFAQRDGRSVAETLRTFSWAPRYLRFTVGEIRAPGFDIVATGANPDHFDVQLLPGRTDSDAAPLAEELQSAAARLLSRAGELRPNPAYNQS
jgi:hypothetical protein